MVEHAVGRKVEEAAAEVDGLVTFGPVVDVVDGGAVADWRILNSGGLREIFSPQARD